MLLLSQHNTITTFVKLTSKLTVLLYIYAPWYRFFVIFSINSFDVVVVAVVLVFPSEFLASSCFVSAFFLFLVFFYGICFYNDVAVVFIFVFVSVSAL